MMSVQFHQCMKCGAEVPPTGTPKFCKECRNKFLAELMERILNPAPFGVDVFTKKTLLIPAPKGDPMLN